MVEFALSHIFALVSTCDNAEIGRAVFYSPQDFSEKLKMTNNAARIFLSERNFNERWKPLLTKLQFAAEERNAFAHFDMVTGIVAEADGGSHITYTIRPNTFNPNERHKKRRPELKWFDYKKVALSERKFSTLANELSALAVNLRNELKSRQK